MQNDGMCAQGHPFDLQEVQRQPAAIQEEETGLSHCEGEMLQPSNPSSPTQNHGWNAPSSTSSKSQGQAVTYLLVPLVSVVQAALLSQQELA